MIRGKDYIGVGCGAFITKDKGHSLLLVKRTKAPDAGYWSIPGGAVEFGETFEQAVIREIREETGLHIEIKELLSLTDHISEDRLTHWVTPQYCAHIVGGTLQNLEPDKHDALEWFDINNLPDQLTMPTLNALRRYIDHNV